MLIDVVDDDDDLRTVLSAIAPEVLRNPGKRHWLHNAAQSPSPTHRCQKNRTADRLDTSWCCSCFTQYTIIILWLYDFLFDTVSTHQSPILFRWFLGWFHSKSVSAAAEWPKDVIVLRPPSGFRMHWWKTGGSVVYSGTSYGAYHVWRCHCQVGGWRDMKQNQFPVVKNLALMQCFVVDWHVTLFDLLILRYVYWYRNMLHNIFCCWWRGRDQTCWWLRQRSDSQINNRHEDPVTTGQFVQGCSLCWVNGSEWQLLVNLLWRWLLLELAISRALLKTRVAGIGLSLSIVQPTSARAHDG